MNKKSGPTPPTSDTEHPPEPQPEIPEIGPDPEQFEGLLQDIVDSVRKYRESQHQKGEPPP